MRRSSQNPWRKLLMLSHPVSNIFHFRPKTSLFTAVDLKSLAFESRVDILASSLAEGILSELRATYGSPLTMS